MRAYIDTSVLLRIVLGEPNRLREWHTITYGVSSALIEVECLRTLDRLRVRGALDEDRLAKRRERVFYALETLEIIEVSKPILSRASSPFPTSLGTLDAIHLATAIAYRDIRGLEVAVLTHDKELAMAARSVGFDTLGV
ncbi:MAG: type II toxin-antitoxin system VapC family toxin [Myxococcota bacterium]|nr:type II toxin-antitoxin system VapC family toxin [Myxococcota bacterium]